MLEMEVGSSTLGPSLSDTCSPCVDVPTGAAVPFSIRRAGGELLDSGNLHITSDIPELGFAYSVNGLIPGPVACDREPTGFCNL